MTRFACLQTLGRYGRIQEEDRRIADIVESCHFQLMILTGKLPWLKEASRKKRWLVGVSGGADSVALLLLLCESGFQNLIVCHLDHRLRGQASAEDARFVERLAGRLGLQVEIGQADVSARMEESRDSLETAARHARHQFFGSCAEKYECPRLLLAHHADDQAETALWNFLRGSRGMKGMATVQEIKTAGGTVLEIHRPLLPVSHSELVAWLVSQKQVWREDASNQEPIAIRNRLRNEVLPLLAEISGRDVVPAFTRAIADAEEFQAVESWALERADVIDPQGRLHLPVLRKLPEPLQCTAIRNFLQDHGVGNIDRALLQRCLALRHADAPSVINLPGGRYLKRRAGRLLMDG